MVEKLNVLLKNHDEYSFNVDVLNCGSPMNLTMTKAPVLDDKSGLITVNFDGTFFDTVAKTNHVSMPPAYHVRNTGATGNSQQVFIHQSMLASVFFALDKEFFPMKLNNEKIAGGIKSAFGEIAAKYGSDVKITLEVNFIPEDGRFLTLNASTGIEIGRYVEPTAIVTILCSNDTVTEEIGIQISTKLNATLNVTLDNYLVYAFIPNAVADNTQFMVDNVGIKKMKKDIINIMINTALQMAVEIANEELKTPFDVKTLNPEYMQFIAQLFVQPRVTPYYQDEYLYAGITYLFDMYSSQQFQKLRLESQLLNSNNAVLNKIINKLLF